MDFNLDFMNFGRSQAGAVFGRIEDIRISVWSDEAAGRECCHLVVRRDIFITLPPTNLTAFAHCRTARPGKAFCCASTSLARSRVSWALAA
jgi:hypothetical protein